MERVREDKLRRTDKNGRGGEDVSRLFSGKVVAKTGGKFAEQVMVTVQVYLDFGGGHGGK